MNISIVFYPIVQCFKDIGVVYSLMMAGGHQNM